MRTPFLGSEALAAGRITKHRLRTYYEPAYPDVYVPKGKKLTASSGAVAVWLWSGRRGVLAGRSAAKMHGAKSVDDSAPAQLLHRNRRPPKDVEVWSDRVADDEIVVVRGMRVTSRARTALDLACRMPIEDAIPAIDALARATRLDLADVDRLARRYPGRRSIRRGRAALAFVDADAESPQETRIRLVFIKAGFPRPETQIKLYDEYGRIAARLDMGWRDVQVGADYEGEHHRTSAAVFNYDIRRHDIVTELGWNDLRYTIEDPDSVVVDRARRAFAKRGRILDVWPNRFPLFVERA